MTPYEYMLKHVLPEPVYRIGYDPGLPVGASFVYRWFSNEVDELNLYPFQREMLKRLTGGKSDAG